MVRKIIRSAAAVFVVALSGCTWLGPEIIRSGRPAYNDAILATNDEQLLQNIVRLRFGDSLGFLTVSSVTANVTFTGTAGVELPFGRPLAAYAGALVPFSSSLSAEQNPTISYAPVSGDRVLRQLANETPLDLAILLIKSAHSHKEAWNAIVRRVNNVRNPDFLDPPLVVVEPRFEGIAALTSTLQRLGSLYWVRLSGAQTGYAVVLHSYSPTGAGDVAQLLNLLGIAKPVREGDDIMIPVRLSVGSPDPDAITIETRSLLDLMRLAAARIELPRDAAVGALRYPEPGPAGQGIRILSSDVQPAQARVAVEYRGRWYYIEHDDEASKQWFMMLQLLANAQVPDATPGLGPMLTLPVSGRR